MMKNSHKNAYIIRKVNIYILILLTASTQLNAGTVPGYIASKAIGIIEGAIQDKATGLITRDGEAIAKAHAVWMDYGIALDAQWYADQFAYYRKSLQKNHLQGEEIINGGFELLDRKIAYHDWSVWNHDGNTPADDPILTGDFERIAGKGLAVVKNDSDTWIGEGTIKYWNAKYVIFSDFSNTGSEGLKRPPGKFNLRIESILADLNYSASKGLTSIERGKPSYRHVKVSKVQMDKVTNFDLLEENTEIVEGPAAFGKCRRVWKLKLPDKSALEWFWLSFDSDALTDILVNGHSWEVHEFQIDYG